MWKSAYNMYTEGPKGSSYDITTTTEKESDYDMYSDNKSACGVDHIHMGPTILEVCRHKEGVHICVYDPETEEVIAQTEVSEHPIEDHFETIKENIQEIQKAYTSRGSLKKSERPAQKCFVPKKWECNKSQKLEHYSPKEGLTQIDPQFKGRGVDVRSNRAFTEHPHSFYYMAGTEPESIVAQSAKKKYVVDLPEEAKIYDIHNDPENFTQQVLKENNGAFNRDMLLGKIKSSGYHGFTHSGSALPNVVALFHAMPISETHDV